MATQQRHRPLLTTDRPARPHVTRPAGARAYTLQLPSDKGILLPGNYMLFALDANGTPSVARIMNIR
ncbi:MAG TPA: galactose oxidase-like domain-containing protein [Streptosporangiaceae bacterium]|nr:galactose oxidase-like domain-containing protein [Streptosporangiaceae bacterium]